MRERADTAKPVPTQGEVQDKENPDGQQHDQHLHQQRPQRQRRQMEDYYEEDAIHVPSTNLGPAFAQPAVAQAKSPPVQKGKRRRSYVMTNAKTFSFAMRSPNTGEASKAGSPTHTTKDSE